MENQKYQSQSVHQGSAQQRNRLLIWSQFMVWVSAFLFMLAETYILAFVPVSSLVSLVIFGGLMWVMVPCKYDKYNLFCWYHYAMTSLLLLVGILDFINFYTEWINETMINATMVGLQITLVSSAIHKLIKWINQQKI